MTLQDFNNSVYEAREHLRASDVPVYKKPISDYIIEFLAAGTLIFMFYVLYIFINLVVIN